MPIGRNVGATGTHARQSMRHSGTVSGWAVRLKRLLPLALVGLLSFACSWLSDHSVKGEESGAALLAVAFLPPFLRAPGTRLKESLGPTLNDEGRARLDRGLKQVGAFWRDEDGDGAVFEAFVREHFLSDPVKRDATFHRLEFVIEQLSGHLHEIYRAWRWHSELEVDALLPVDDILAAYSPSAHVTDDFFHNKLAFVVLLNFPLTTLEERMQEGPKWSRRQWAEARLTYQFSSRVPAAVSQERAVISAKADGYIAGYNFWMHHVVSSDGTRLFPARQRLIAHWGLRDELKAAYSDPKGLPRQRMISRMLERVVAQEVPACVVDNPAVDWDPVSNSVRKTQVNDADRPIPEGDVCANVGPDLRYHHLHESFRGARREDPFHPHNGTLISRRFNEHRELPEARVQALLEALIKSPQYGQVAAVIERRLGRKLEPFDIWYNGFRPRGQYSEAWLDAKVRERYTTPPTFAADIPSILERVGFEPEKATWLAERITVDPARGAGHAMGAVRRGDKAHLRTRFEKDGMNYKGFNVAMHELGHNVEQTFSLYGVDSWFMQGVPNTAFTEALAFVFQAKDLEMLGLSSPSEETHALNTLSEFWGAAEIAGVGLVDMEVWRWMYTHKDFSDAELRDAVIQIAKDVWNRLYAPVFEVRDVTLLACYSHMIDSLMYLPDYSLGHIIAYQIDETLLASPHVGKEIERMFTLGLLTPDVWMEQATGGPVSVDPMLRGVSGALELLKKTQH